MTPERVREITVGRLARWTEDVVADHATPVLLLAAGHDHRQGSVSVCVCEGISDAEVIAMLEGAARLVSRARQKRKGGAP